MGDLLLSEAAKTLPVALGGFLAILGGFGSQWLVHRLTDRRDRKKLRREKLEALVKALYAHGQWIEEKHEKMIFKGEDHIFPNPLDEARMLQALHFPELADELSAVQTAQIPLLKFINEQWIAQMKSKEQFLKDWNPLPFREAYQYYLACCSALVERARTLHVAE